MQNGTSRMRASVRASSVLPEPVGPMSRMLLFSISTSASGSIASEFPPSDEGPTCVIRL